MELCVIHRHYLQSYLDKLQMVVKFSLPLKNYERIEVPCELMNQYGGNEFVTVTGAKLL